MIDEETEQKLIAAIQETKKNTWREGMITGVITHGVYEGYKKTKGSIQSTQQITKAMKLVSTVKLQKAKGRAEQTDPYFQYMYRTVSSILAHSGNIDHPYLRSGESKKKAIVVLTSNRGLAGGYNANVVKLITESDDVAKEDVVIYAVGRKGIEILERKDITSR